MAGWRGYVKERGLTMDVDDVKTYRDAIQCLSDNQFRWASAIASDTGDKTVAVECVFDLLIANAGRDVCGHKTED